MTTGERIKKRRLELGLSQLELAHRLGNTSRASVCTVEKDKEDMTTDRIRKYAKALETTPAYIMGWEENHDSLTGMTITTPPGLSDYILNQYEQWRSDPRFMEHCSIIYSMNPEYREKVYAFIRFTSEEEKGISEQESAG